MKLYTTLFNYMMETLAGETTISSVESLCKQTFMNTNTQAEMTILLSDGTLLKTK